MNASRSYAMVTVRFEDGLTFKFFPEEGEPWYHAQALERARFLHSVTLIGSIQPKLYSITRD